MFSAGKVFKVKVETSPGEIGFGRATILKRLGNKFLVKLSTRRDSNKVLPKGTKIWFVNLLPNDVFNGLWASLVAGTQIAEGHTTMVCAHPKPEPFVQKRRTVRVAVDVPVRVFDSRQVETGIAFGSKDISRSGMAIETKRDVKDAFQVGEHVRLYLETAVGEIWIQGRIIRVDRNWFANKTVMGLEFTNVAPDQAKSLDKLLLSLGGKPRHSKKHIDECQKTGQKIAALQGTSLSGSIPTSQADTSLVNLVKKSGGKKNGIIKRSDKSKDKELKNQRSEERRVRRKGNAAK